MSIRTQRYRVEPASACPTSLLIGGKPPTTIDLDLDEVSKAGWAEILQTAPGSSSLFSFLEDMLAVGDPELVWQGQGPGRGTEMRRAFSGLLGRIFARGYLECHHDFVWFAAIDGDDFRLAPKVRVIKKPGSTAEMPDWICAAPGRLAVAEAKGSHQKGEARGVTKPGPIKTAEGQITGVLIQKEIVIGGRPHWRNLKIKGWAVMSRWGLQTPARKPFLYALDPDTDGEPPSAEELEEVVRAVAYTHVGQLAEGLGLSLTTTDRPAMRVEPQRVEVVGDADQRMFYGVFVTPFGALDLDWGAAQALASLLSDPDAIRFVGFDELLLDDFVAGRPIVARRADRIGQRALVGRDGLLVAPLSMIAEPGVIIDRI